MKFDYVTLMLINMAAGFFLLACFVFEDLEKVNPKRWVAAFLLPGAIAFLLGLHMVFTWPLPGSYNIAFGELSVLWGGLLLAASLALAYNWDLKPLGIYGFFSGLVSVITGLQFLRLGLSNTPVMAGFGFLLSGFAGLFSLPVLLWRSNKPLRFFSGTMLMIIALLWAYFACTAYWGHLAIFSK
ncbi:MAG TPA: DUF981 domain-containing protein [Candidatus Omnitrophota bacterium]|nr:DUF981 domain-containing protein [Candidatus Omnitrophota bacterium]